jgi:hypothetical protein
LHPPKPLLSSVNLLSIFRKEPSSEFQSDGRLVAILIVGVLHPQDQCGAFAHLDSNLSAEGAAVAVAQRLKMPRLLSEKRFLYTLECQGKPNSLKSGFSFNGQPYRRNVKA